MDTQDTADVEGGGIKALLFKGRKIDNTDDLEKVVPRRDKNHHKNKEGFGEAKLDQSSINPDAILDLTRYRGHRFPKSIK